MQQERRTEEERGQARGGSGEPPVPDAGTPPGTGEEVASDREASTGAAETAAEPGPVGPEGAVEVPSGHEVPDDLREEIEAIMTRYPEKRSASMPALFAVQRRYGWCTPEGIAHAAAVMGVTPAYLEGVASFYDLFFLEPVGRHRVLVCTNISCWLRGADGLLGAFCEATGIAPEDADHGGASSPDGEVFLQGFECLGACDIAPMASIDEHYYGPLTGEDAAAAVEQLRSGADVLPGKALAERPAAGGPEPPPDERVAATESD